MNKARREAIQAAIAKIKEGQSELESIRDEEQEYYDTMPENFQSGEKGQAAQEAIELLETAVSYAEEAISVASDVQ